MVVNKQRIPESENPSRGIDENLSARHTGSMGRPPIDQTKRRSVKLQVTLSEAEAEQVRQRALNESTAAERVSASDIIRRAVQRFLRSSRA
jgi:hypothetical protein